MKNHPKWFGKKFVFAGLVFALMLGAFSCVLLHRKKLIRQKPKPDITELDAKAKPHFDRAKQNIPAVVKELSSFGTLFKLSWLLAKDKACDSKQTEEFLSQALAPVIIHCQNGAQIYGCAIDSKQMEQDVSESGKYNTLLSAYAAGSLALEAVFLKATVSSLRTVLNAIVRKLSVSYGGGAVCALADGPFPIGDAFGVILAAGGTLLSCYDLYTVSRNYPEELTAILQQAVDDYWSSCRKVVLE